MCRRECTGVPYETVQQNDGKWDDAGGVERRDGKWDDAGGVERCEGKCHDAGGVERRDGKWDDAGGVERQCSYRTMVTYMAVVTTEA